MLRKNLIHLCFEKIFEYKFIWNTISVLGYITLIIELCKTERDYGIILTIGIFLICAKLDLLREELFDAKKDLW